MAKYPLVMAGLDPAIYARTGFTKDAVPVNNHPTAQRAQHVNS
jgi:hypothetical protein